jgi:hypothetical protein
LGRFRPKFTDALTFFRAASPLEEVSSPNQKSDIGNYADSRGCRYGLDDAPNEVALLVSAILRTSQQNKLA